MGKAITGKDAVDQETYNLLDQGRKPAGKINPVIPEPAAPEVDNIIQYTRDLETGLDSIDSITRGDKKNKEGTIFIGYNVRLILKGGKPLDGWMPELEYIKFRRSLLISGKMNTDSLLM